MSLLKVLRGWIKTYHTLSKTIWLVGGLEHVLFSIIYGINFPNWLIFFRGVETTNHLVMTNIAMENPLQMEVSSWENHPFRLGPSKNHGSKNDQMTSLWFHGVPCTNHFMVVSACLEFFLISFPWSFWVNYNEPTTSEPWKSWFL